MKDGVLGDFVTLKRGYDLPNGSRRDGEVPVISSSGPTGTHNEAKVEGPGVVTGRYGTLGEVFFCESAYWPLNTALYVTDFKGNDPKFIYYFMQTLGLGQQNAAGAVPGLNRNVLHKLRVRVPELTAQQRIAQALSAYDDLIENNSRRMALLDEAMHLLFREWFTYLRYPGQNRQRQDGGTPAGWQGGSIGDLCEIVRGKSYTSEELADPAGRPFVTLKNIDRGGGFRLPGLKTFSGKFKQSQESRPGDILVAVTDMGQKREIVARAARVPLLPLLDGAVFSMDLVKCVPRDQRDSAFVLWLLRASTFPDEVKNHANGTNVLHLHPDRITDFRCLLPPPALRERFSEEVVPLQEQVDLLWRTNLKLQAARDLLLPRLMDGRIPV